MEHGDQSNTPQGLRSFITFRLMRLQAQINAQSQFILRMHSDLGLTEWRVLSLIRDRGESTMALVVRDGKIDKAQVSRAVKSLVAKTYIRSRVDPSDQRQSILTVTETGEIVHETVMPMMAERRKHLTAGISQAEMETFTAIVDRLEIAAQRRSF